MLLVMSFASKNIKRIGTGTISYQQTATLVLSLRSKLEFSLAFLLKVIVSRADKGSKHLAILLLSKALDNWKILA